MFAFIRRWQARRQAQQQYEASQARILANHAYRNRDGSLSAEGQARLNQAQQRLAAAKAGR